MKFALFTLLLGLSKCGVLVKLYASVRNSSVKRSLSGTEDAEIQVYDAGTTQKVAAAGAEPGLVDRRERFRVIEELSRADATQLLDGRFDLIGGLVIARGVQRGAGSCDREGPALDGRGNAVDLPASGDPAGHAAGCVLLALTEREFVDIAELEDVRDVVAGLGAIAAELRQVVK